MDLQFYLNVLKRRIFLIAIVVAVSLSVVAVAGLVITPVYTASATVRVLLDVGLADFTLREDYSRRLLNTYAHLLRSEPFLTEVRDRLAPETDTLTLNELYESTEVEVVPDTELISIAVASGEPILARDIANMLSTLLVEYAQDLYVGNSKSTLEILDEQLSSLENEIKEDQQRLEALLAEGVVGGEVDILRSQVKFKEDSYDRLLDSYEMARLNDSLRANSITVSTPATIPQNPSNSITFTQIGLTLVIGLFAGVGLALVLENLDTSIWSPQQLEHLTNLPVLGTVPSGRLSLGNLGIVSENGDIKTLEEAYRVLGVNLPALKEVVSVQTILITSAVPKEGKTTVSANLAQILAERGQPIFLVESDLRHPHLFKVLGMDAAEEEDPGLGSLLVDHPLLIDNTSLNSVIHATDQPDLFIVGGGGAKVPNPTALLASSFMEDFLGYLGTQGYMTLLDAPPVLGMADVSVLAPKVEGVIMVVMEAHSKREQVLAALKQLEASRAHVFGFVFVQKGDKAWRYE